MKRTIVASLINTAPEKYVVVADIFETENEDESTNTHRTHSWSMDNVIVDPVEFVLHHEKNAMVMGRVLYKLYLDGVIDIDAPEGDESLSLCFKRHIKNELAKEPQERTIIQTKDGVDIEWVGSTESPHVEWIKNSTHAEVMAQVALFTEKHDVEKKND